MSDLEVIILSGPLCAGKTTLAEALAERVGARVASARDVLLKHSDKRLARQELQRSGQRVEAETGGKWLADGIRQARSASELTIIDSVRTTAQVSAIRRYWPQAVLIHLAADEDERQRRYEHRSRSEPIDAGLRFAVVMAGENEYGAEQLRPIAQLVVDTTSLNPADVVELSSAFLKGNGLKSAQASARGLGFACES